MGNAQKPAFTEAEINMFKSQPWTTKKMSKFVESKQLKISKKKWGKMMQNKLVLYLTHTLICQTHTHTLICHTPTHTHTHTHTYIFQLAQNSSFEK